MKRYMVLVKDEDGNQFTRFFDKFQEADNYRMDAEVGLGWYAAIYSWRRLDEDDPYEPESYYEI